LIRLAQEGIRGDSSEEGAAVIEGPIHLGNAVAGHAEFGKKLFANSSPLGALPG
jgi:hypothetical protein